MRCPKDRRGSIERKLYAATNGGVHGANAVLQWTAVTFVLRQSYLKIKGEKRLACICATSSGVHAGMPCCLANCRNLFPAILAVAIAPREVDMMVFLCIPGTRRTVT